MKELGEDEQNSFSDDDPADRGWSTYVTDANVTSFSPFLHVLSYVTCVFIMHPFCGDVNLVVIVRRLFLQVGG